MTGDCLSYEELAKAYKDVLDERDRWYAYAKNGASIDKELAEKSRIIVERDRLKLALKKSEEFREKWATANCLEEELGRMYSVLNSEQHIIEQILNGSHNGTTIKDEK